MQNDQNTETNAVYTSGIPTLRSSAHRVRYSTKKAKKNANAPQPKRQHHSASAGDNNKKNDKQNNNPQQRTNKSNSNDETNTDETMLPLSIRKEMKFPYDCKKYDLSGAIISLLQELDPEIVGSFLEHDEQKQGEQQHNPIIKEEKETKEEEPDLFIEDLSLNTTNNAKIEEEEEEKRRPRLEDFYIPPKTLIRKSNKGRCEETQQYLSDAVASNETFLTIFDALVEECIVPHLKSRLIAEGIINDQTKEEEEEEGETATVTATTKTSFYYQRPPTLRLQPGPAWAMVKAHRDADYGHQPGELNFWIPLTDKDLTKVDLFCESDEDLGDYTPLGTKMGEVSSFHGSACRHYVTPNHTRFTRVSLDFRIGIEPFYDPEWEMIGTKDDHCRRVVQM